MSLRIAILDLGTNTFHLMVVETNAAKKNPLILFRDERWVFLAEKGIETVAASAMARATDTLRQYGEIISGHQCNVVAAFGTAAFRKASNSNELKKMVEDTIGTEINIVPGDREAELIYKGVRWATNMQHEVSMIMDIGGGSTEFIIGNKEKIFWKKSFPLGASILKQKFHHHEPILESERKEMHQFIGSELQELHEMYHRHKPEQFIGASGSFDSFASMLTPDTFSSLDTIHLMKKGNLLQLFQKLYGLNLEDRRLVKGLIAFRAEMIVTAAVLTQYILDSFHFERILQSGYALKEGVLTEMIQ